MTLRKFSDFAQTAKNLLWPFGKGTLSPSGIRFFRNFALLSSLAYVTLPGVTCWAGDPHPLNLADLEPFLDGLVGYQIEREDIAGAVIAVVKDGQVLFAKGYGFADNAKKQPVLADSTLFRPGSVSKLFVWTSVMQQVEEG